VGLSINILFAILWFALGTFALRTLFGRYFGYRGANVAAIAIVAAFAVGAYWPFSERIGRPADVNLPVAAAPGAPPPVVAMRDRSALCHAKNTAQPGGVGNLDVLRKLDGTETPIATGATISSSDGLAMLGWSADSSAQAPSLGVCLIVDGRVAAARVRYGGPRADVAAAYHRDTLLNSAFEVDVAARTLPAGKHSLRIAALGQDGGLRFLTGERTVTVH
jgi:hypothetical protein